eukprot:m.72737 g.72737  ORF g.72737 m.72737 type:complete len:1754 (-) comp8396_c1_seq1:31-5292(-)
MFSQLSIHQSETFTTDTRSNTRSNTVVVSKMRMMGMVSPLVAMAIFITIIATNFGANTNNFATAASCSTCQSSCTSSQYETAVCVPSISTEVLDYEGMNTSSITVHTSGDNVKSAAAVNQLSIFSGYYGTDVYVVIRGQGGALAVFNFTLCGHQDVTYNVSASYGYAMNSNNYPTNLPYELIGDGLSFGKFMQNQQMQPTEQFTNLGQVIATNYIVVKVQYDDIQTSFGSLDAVFITPAYDVDLDGMSSMCEEFTVCNQNTQYISVNETSTSDRTCTFLTMCDAWEYESTANTLYSDRSCSDLTNCTMSQFEATASTPTSDRLCQAISNCSSSQYESMIPSETSDRVCTAVSTCAQNQFITANETATTDLVCGNVTACFSSSQYQVSNPTAYLDRVCANVTMCQAEEFVSVNHTTTSDRTCSFFTKCLSSQYQTREPSLYVDRECTSLTVCTPSQYEAAPQTATSDRTCSNCTVCNMDTEIEDVACASTSNTVCRPITVDYAYGPYGNFSVSCENQTRTRTESCADVKCKNRQPTSDTININGGCEDLCAVDNGDIVCSCTSPFYVIDVVNCTNVYCNVPSFGNASQSSTSPLKIGADVFVLCDEGYNSTVGDMFLVVCQSSGILTSSPSCLNINECNVDNGGCAGLCIDTDGSFYCKDINPCLTNNGGCDHTCTYGNMSGVFSCSCDAGYELNGLTTCADVNECDTNNGGCEQSCNNNDGGFSCACTSGYVIDNVDVTQCNKMSCSSPATQFSSMNTVTAQLQSSGPFVFMDVLTYACESGFTVDGDANSPLAFNLTCMSDGSINGTYNGCEDVNECQTTNGGCEQTCTNTFGSLVCTCTSGYEVNSITPSQCDNIDECSTSNPCDHICTDSVGSFTCSCNQGFTLAGDGTSCVRNGCSDTVPSQLNNATRNTGEKTTLLFQETAKFTCNDGYSRNGASTGGTTFTLTCGSDGEFATTETNAGCLDINECNDDVMDSPCNQTCTNTVGSYVCSCGTGYLLTNALECVDVDECMAVVDPCISDSNTECVNSYGSYSCDCITGFDIMNNVCQRVEYNLLSSDIVTQDILPIQRFASSRIYFGGDRGMRLNVPFVASSTFSFAFEVIIAPQTSGYIFSVSSKNGIRRDFAIYTYKSSNKLGLYYKRIDGSIGLTSLTLPYIINDGQSHYLIIAVSGTSVTVKIDSTNNDIFGTLETPITWCAGASATDCYIYVGKRSSNMGGSYFVSGIFKQLFFRPFDLTATISKNLVKDPSPSIAGPSFVDLLSESNRQNVGAVQTTTDGGIELDGKSAVIIPSFHKAVVGSPLSFTVTITVNVARGTSGYIFSKTTDTGSRYYGLYCSLLQKTTFYYRIEGFATQHLVSFPVDLSDGITHRVMLTVKSTTASLYVDNALVKNVTLAGTVDDCATPSSSCILQLGRRADSSFVNGRFFLTGTIEHAILFSGVQMKVDPSPLPISPPLVQTLAKDDAGHEFLDLLDVNNTFSVGNVNRITEGVFFNRTGRLVVENHAITVGPSFSYACIITIPKNERGYIFAYTNAIGTTRHLALYVSSSVLVMYYTTTKAPSGIHSYLFSTVKVNDGLAHNLLLQLEYNTLSSKTDVTLYVDGSEMHSGSIAGTFTTCGARSALCGLSSGERLSSASSGGAYGIFGTISVSRLYPNSVISVSDSPSTSVAGPPYFSVTRSRYIPGQNQGGAFRSGVSIEDCARKCLTNTLCKSFDAGVQSSSQEGSCFLGYVKNGDAGVVLAESVLFNYYEKL